MSCKIERIVSPEAMVVLRISGRIDGEHVDTLRELIAREKAGVAIDLTEVLLVDREAVRLLAASEANRLVYSTEQGCPQTNSQTRDWIESRNGLPASR
jgi:hypothetical protein